MKIPTMHELYNNKTGVTPFLVGDCEIFVNFNRQLRPFIRVNKYPNHSKTFNFTKKGYAQAVDYLIGVTAE